MRLYYPPHYSKGIGGGFHIVVYYLDIMGKMVLTGTTVLWSPTMYIL